jgi:TatD DNase family protein
LAITHHLLEDHAVVFSMIGAHPHQASDYDAAVEARIVEFLQYPRVLALGEAGLDFHYNFSPPDVQRRVFERQVYLAKEHDLPLLVHSRLAEPDVLSILDAVQFVGPLVFHCYTGTAEMAREIVARGGYISFSGIVTFKKADELRHSAKVVPLDRLLVETDAPYLAPEPHRGERNTPLRSRLVAQALAAVQGVALEELDRAVVANFRRVYRLDTVTG